MNGRTRQTITVNTGQESSQQQMKPTNNGTSEEEARISEYHRLKVKEAQSVLSYNEHAFLGCLATHVNWWK